MPVRLIFEGPELAGKSWVMSRVYDRLEATHNLSRVLLDGCHWFNADIGVWGAPEGRAVLNGYLKIFAALSDRNLLVEKFHLTHRVNRRLLFQRTIGVAAIEHRLAALGFKIVHLRLPADEAVIKARLADRLRLYPHYARIAHEPAWYLRVQQPAFDRAVKSSQLPALTLDTATFPDETLPEKILVWIGEK